uniref:Uncharacterized protein n=1 Tax=Angiostrongylus cantonensis TaxID=6313 RepID=A0A0K0DCA9_ANGCA
MQGDTISLKFSIATFNNFDQGLEWDNMRVKIDRRQLNYHRIADSIVLMTPRLIQVKLTLTDFDKAFGKTGLQLNLAKQVQELWIGFIYSIFAQQNEYLRMLQFHLYRSENYHCQRRSGGVEHKEKSWLESFQEHRGCIEENREHPNSCPSFRLHDPFRLNVYVSKLVATQAG